MLYADARLWLQQGWLDYFTPQLYWNINQQPQSFPVLLAWWQQQNFQDRHLWPGLNSNKVATVQGIDEVVNQIMFTRALMPASAGQVFWNVRTVSDNPRFNQLLADTIYHNQALVPPSPWLDNTPPEPPAVEIQGGDEMVVKWQNSGSEPAFRWVLYYKDSDRWRYRIFNQDTLEFAFPAEHQITDIAVVAVDRTGLKSERIELAVDDPKTASADKLL